MAVPKKKMARPATRTRRAAWKATWPQLVTVKSDGKDVVVPRRLKKAVEMGLFEPRNEFQG
ncbi:MAG: 50S ribosomal protein L32 [Actinomycetaceae bacterium]|nr:50S ribosomal protein L32 [Actinomycetaceae bacterium]